MTELRWCIVNIDGSIDVHAKPTATDALEFAEKALHDSGEFDCCKSDERLKDLYKVKELLGATSNKAFDEITKGINK